jgi:hypothetical protein
MKALEGNSSTLTSVEDMTMTGAQKLLEFEASFVKKLLRLGPLGFVLGYSLTIVSSAFVLWSAIMACTTAGLFSVWHGRGLAFTSVGWSVVLVLSIFYATAQWVKQSRINPIKR